MNIVKCICCFIYSGQYRNWILQNKNLKSLFQNSNKHILVNTWKLEYEMSLQKIYAVSTIQLLVCPTLLIIYIDWVVSSWC